MLEGDKDNENEGTNNDIEEDCTQKLIRPSDIKQEAIHTDLENIDDDDLEGSTMLDDDDDSDYEGNEGNDDSKNGGESNSPKKSKINKNSVKKKTPEILIPQMVSLG